MGFWKVHFDSLGDTPYEFSDTRRVTGREVLRPEFLRELARRGEVIEEEMRVVGPEGKGRYTDTFLIISLSDEKGGVHAARGELHGWHKDYRRQGQG